MARDASGTREALLSAGLRLFAEHGIHGAQMRDVVRAAKQSNDSAVHYHFGSRDGLLLAICERYVGGMEPARRARLDAQPANPSLARAVRDLVEPTAELLKSPGGRQFLQLMAQLASHSGVRTGVVPAPVAGTALIVQLEQIRARCPRSLPPRLARERVAFMIGALTVALAERARAVDAGVRPALGYDAFVSNLDAMLVGALSAR